MELLERNEWLGLAGLSRAIVLYDIEESFQARLHAVVGGVRIDLQDQVWESAGYTTDWP